MPSRKMSDSPLGWSITGALNAVAWVSFALCQQACSQPQTNQGPPISIEKRKAEPGPEARKSDGKPVDWKEQILKILGSGRYDYPFIVRFVAPEHRASRDHWQTFSEDHLRTAALRSALLVAALVFLPSSLCNRASTRRHRQKSRRS